MVRRIKLLLRAGARSPEIIIESDPRNCSGCSWAPAPLYIIRARAAEVQRLRCHGQNLQDRRDMAIPFKRRSSRTKTTIRLG